MPLMQPYIKQGLGLHLEEDLVVPEDLEANPDVRIMGSPPQIFKGDRQ